ncbi:MAG: phosphoribosyl-AMP cyclohydrolase [Elusimicrobia bacterium]|nr:phosphoribosyl-AMP cyclohydrolase [Elusimicrobiota bacterium]
MNYDDIKFDDRGLIPCVTQDSGDGRVLMMAYMSRESLQKTIETGKACYFSRSRGKLWLKGEESGNVQIVKEIFIDCDKDTILIKVEQAGECACHKGYRSCFYRKLSGSGWKIIDKIVKDPGKMYGK